MADNVFFDINGRCYGVAKLNAAKTHCPRGHEYTPENTRWMTQKRRRVRRCKACERASKKRSYARKTGKPTTRKGLFGPI